MNFLRENLFMILLTIGTLILCLVLVFWSNSIADQIDEKEISVRNNLSSTIQRLDRRPYANGNTIMAERNLVEGIVDSLRKVGDKNITWNGRNFQVPQLAMLDGSTRPAFPFDASVWEKNQLASRFLGQYHNQLASLLASMKPTGLPTATELVDEAEYQQKRIERQKQIEDKAKVHDTSSARTPRSTTPGRAAAAAPVMPMDMMPPEMEGFPSQRSVAGKTSAGNEAEYRAREILRVRKAKEGLIYADDSLFHLVFPRGINFISASDIDPEEFWDAQVGFWVQSDIVAVINDTIRDAQEQQKLPSNQRNVINSPIKQLMKINVGTDDSTTTKKKTSPSRGFAMPPGMRGGPGPGGEFPMEDPAMMDHMPSSATPRQTSRTSSRRTSTPTTPGVKPDTLTENTANKIFDVVDYSFTVLMPTRYLPLLEENLLKRNYHVILNIQIELPDDDLSAQRSSADKTQNLYYYGSEPIRKVTIKGQLLLVTGFTRGVWDNEKQEWTHKSLMPLETMKKLDASALRNEDRLLVDGRLNQFGKPPEPVVTTPSRGAPVQPSPGGTPRRGPRRIVRPSYAK